ncbi:MAG TPA: helix-turn-helix transcriptional regulator [Tissierellales bacterium]|nr:helix-turn-helix transcriptional regulator [Tissierellales bacterium]
MSKKTLRQLRRERDITQEELSRMTRITSRSITTYENNVQALRSASYDYVERLAKALDVDIDDIFLG